MTRSIASIIFLILPALCRAFSIGIPEPEDMLRKASVVAVASMMEKDGKFEIYAKRILKGALKPGRYAITSPFPPQIYTLASATRAVGTEDFVFVGGYDADKDEISAIYIDCSFWPQGTGPHLLKHRTLEGCIKFAEQELALLARTQKPQNTLPQSPKPGSGGGVVVLIAPPSAAAPSLSKT